MTKSLKFSIITPSFNSIKYIEDAIKSVLSQQYDNFEHIIIDGGSTDDTIKMLKKYSHLKWISEPDEGQSDALNKGFKMATGDIIGWLNADDYYLEGTFNIVALKFQSDASIDVVYGDCKFVDFKNDLISVSKTISLHKFILLNRFYIPSTSTFFRKTIIDEGHYLNKGLHYVMDKEFFLRLAYKNKKFTNIPNVLASFRWHQNNKSLETGFNTKRSDESIQVNKMFSAKYLPKPFTNIHVKINYYLGSLIFYSIYYFRKIVK